MSGSETGSCLTISCKLIHFVGFFIEKDLNSRKLNGPIWHNCIQDFERFSILLTEKNYLTSIVPDKVSGIAGILFKCEILTSCHVWYALD